MEKKNLFENLLNSIFKNMMRNSTCNNEKKLERDIGKNIKFERV